MGLEDFQQYTQRQTSSGAIQGARGGGIPGLSRPDNDAASENETAHWIGTPPLEF